MKTSFGDFRCIHCGAYVSSLHMLSGVNNRNHCPYCLWSSHLDLYSAGDRLSACKAGMKPIGLTLKRSRNKYRSDSPGELMLVHACAECGALSINRIAADDDPEAVLSVFQLSLGLNQLDFYSQQNITMLGMEDAEVIRVQLFGQVALT
jgi:predicted RNA-binding Zn-ribbon protein involved in translation (DUF1610 family)